MIADLSLVMLDQAMLKLPLYLPCLFCSPVRHMSLRKSGSELVTVSTDCVLLWDLKVSFLCLHQPCTPLMLCGFDTLQAPKLGPDDCNPIARHL